MTPEIYFMENGTTLVFHDGQQEPGLQRPWASIFASWLYYQGIDPTRYRLRMPDGGAARFFRTSEGRWNWEYEKTKEGQPR